MTAVNRIIAIMVLALGIIAAAFVIVMWFDPVNVALRDRLAPDWTNAQRAMIYGFTTAGIIAALGKAIAYVWHEWQLRNMIYARNGLLPAVATAGGSLDASHIDNRAQIMAATVGGNVDRLPGSGMREAIKPPELALPEPAISVSVTPQQILDGYDPEREPHWLLVGQTGSGKSHAVFGITQHIARRYQAQFMVLEKGGVDWNSQAAARTIDGYARALEAVEEERQRRVDLLRAADVGHVSQLPSPPPMLVVVIEEAESTYGRLFEMDRLQARAFMATLRDLASQGRKQGIVLIVATQTGTTGVFDGPTRRNLGNTLIFRSEAIVGDQWGVPRAVNLPTLVSGTAYSTKYACAVSFSLTARPNLPQADLYREPDDLLVSDAIARLDDDPTTVATVATADNRQNGGGYQAVVPVVRLDNGREPTPEEAEAMRQQYKRTPSKTAICKHFYGYKDGAVFDFVTAALEGRI